jgi:hypothetical protein
MIVGHDDRGGRHGDRGFENLPGMHQGSIQRPNGDRFGRSHTMSRIEIKRKETLPVKTAKFFSQQRMDIRGAANGKSGPSRGPASPESQFKSRQQTGDPRRPQPKTVGQRRRTFGRQFPQVPVGFKQTSGRFRSGDSAARTQHAGDQFPVGQPFGSEPAQSPPAIPFPGFGPWKGRRTGLDTILDYLIAFEHDFLT